MKNKLLIIGIGLLLVLQIGIVLAQEEGEEQITIGSQEGGKLTNLCAVEGSPIKCGDDLTLYGENLKISKKDGTMTFGENGGKLIFNQGKPNEIVLEGTKGIEISPLGQITFIEQGASITINGNKFENIAKFDQQFDENPPFILIDRATGEISKAFFNVNPGGGIYNINGNEFDIQNMAGVNYDKKEGELELWAMGPRNNKIKIKSLKGPITLSGKSINFLDKYILSGGKLDVDSNGNFFSTGSIIELNYGLGIFSKDVKIPLFFDGKEHEQGISFGENKIITSNQGKTPFKIIFDQRIEDKDILPGEMKSYWVIPSSIVKLNEYGNEVKQLNDISLIFPPGSKATFENRISEDLIPKLTLSKNSIIREGEKEISYDEQQGEWILNNYHHGYSNPPLTSPVEITSEISDKKVFVGEGNEYSIVSDPKEAKRLRCKVTGQITGYQVCEPYSIQELEAPPDSIRKHNYEEAPVFNFKETVQRTDSLFNENNWNEIIKLAETSNKIDENAWEKQGHIQNTLFYSELSLLLSLFGAEIAKEKFSDIDFVKARIRVNLNDHDWISVSEWTKIAENLEKK